MDYTSKNQSISMKGASDEPAGGTTTSVGSTSGTHLSGTSPGSSSVTYSGTHTTGHTTGSHPSSTSPSGSMSSNSEQMAQQGKEMYDQAQQAMGEAYDATARKVSETYEQAKEYTAQNQGKSLLIALGIGVGIGLLLGASSTPLYRSRTTRYARPIVNALSNIAEEYFR